MQMHYEPTDLAYLAGIIDGEGSISVISEFGRSLSLRLTIGNTDQGLIDWLHETFAGSTSASAPKRLSRKPSAVWYLRGDTAVALLRLVLPFLKIKRERAELGIEAWEHRNPTKGRAYLDAMTRDTRYGYYVAMRKLNGYGDPDRERVEMVNTRWQLVTAPCTVCGKPVERRKSRLKKSGRVLCSPACLKEWHRLNCLRMRQIRYGHDPE